MKWPKARERERWPLINGSCVRWQSFWPTRNRQLKLVACSCCFGALNFCSAKSCKTKSFDLPLAQSNLTPLASSRAISVPVPVVFAVSPSVPRDPFASYTYSQIWGIFGNFPATNYTAQICILIHLPKATTTTTTTEYAFHEICIKHFSLKALQMHKSSSSSSPNYALNRQPVSRYTRRMRHTHFNHNRGEHSALSYFQFESSIKNWKLNVFVIAKNERWICFSTAAATAAFGPPEIWLINYVLCRARKLSRCVYATYTHWPCRLAPWHCWLLQCTIFA